VPITRDQFDQGVSDLANKVLAFLAVTPNEAFSVSEIADGLGWKGGPDSGILGLHGVTEAYELERALDELVNHGLVDRKEINGINYFSARRN
jgi:predicted transcriptional regulator with HTH domain